MKNLFRGISACLVAVTLMTACEEVEETSKYDNWRERNEAYIDSLATLTGDNYVATAEQADAMELGKLYAIQVQSTGTLQNPQYVYCRKLQASTEGERPNYTGYHSTVDVFYIGSLITGDKFDGNFEGYRANDTSIPIPPAKAPTAFDVSFSTSVTEVIPGWTWPLQYMRAGERWMLYIPWRRAYGSSGSGSIPGYSTLAFDIVLNEVK